MFRPEKAAHVAPEEGLQLILVVLMGLRLKPDFVDCEQRYPISRPHVDDAYMLRQKAARQILNVACQC
jgi:hypothetical protein